LTTVHIIIRNRLVVKEDLCHIIMLTGYNHLWAQVWQDLSERDRDKISDTQSRDREIAHFITARC